MLGIPAHMATPMCSFGNYPSLLPNFIALPVFIELKTFFTYFGNSSFVPGIQRLFLLACGLPFYFVNDLSFFF